MRLLFLPMLTLSLLILGCNSPSGEETNGQQVISSSTIISDSASLVVEMKKDSAKTVPKPAEPIAKINKQIQRPNQKDLNNSVGSQKDVTIATTKTEKKPNIPVANTMPPVIKPTTPVVNTPKRKGARIYFPAKKFNYGKIDEGKKINHKFKFINTGDDSLLIKNVDVSCGCTVPKYSNKKIKPGGFGYIDVEYDSKGKFMNQESSIYVYSNSTISPTMELMLEGYVRVALARDKKKDEKKDSTATVPKDLPETPEKTPGTSKKPIMNSDTIKKKKKLPKIFPKTIDKDTANLKDVEPSAED